jgi:hypothetical protein
VLFDDCGDFCGDPKSKPPLPATTQHISIHPAKDHKTEGLQGFCPRLLKLAGGAGTVC